MESSDTLIFERPGSAVTNAYWQLAAAVALTVFAVLGFFTAIFVKVNMLSMQMICTVPMLGAVYLFSSAIRALRMPAMVRVNPRTLEVVRRSGSILVLPWEQIVLVNAGSPAMTATNHLTLYDAAGKVLIRLSDDFLGFPAMEAAIRARQAQSPQAAEVKRGQGRRKGVFFMLFGVIFLALGVVNICISLKESRDRELFQKSGQPASGTVVRQFVAPDGRTHRIEFRVDGAPNAPVVNVEVNQILWTSMTAGKHIPIIAVPDHPDIAHLAIGEIRDNSMPSSGLMIVLNVAIGLFAIATFVVGVLVFRGRQAKWL